jgi:hypothetical protein
MGTINTRISLRSSNTFRNTISQRHDRSFSVETRVDQGTRLIKETSIGSPHELASGVNFYDSTESGANANQVYVFIRNNTSTALKTLTVVFNKNGVRDDVILLNGGEFALFPWKCDATTDTLEMFSNDASGVKVEYIISPMQ